MNEIPDPYYLDESGYWRFREHEGQRRVMHSDKRFILMLAGAQSGKTVVGPWWLLREVMRRGAGDYMVVAPSYSLMSKKVLPEFVRLFQMRLQLGTYQASKYLFEFSPRGQEIAHGGIQQSPTLVFFGHAQNPDSLESATAKAAWLDEAGQRMFRRGSWEAIQRRLSIHEGRVLITTTPYTLGWLKTELYEPAKAGSDLIDLIQFESTMNPVFPAEEFERMRDTLPGWKFNMMYRGRFERPAGMIYDVFRRDAHCIPRFPIPDRWHRYMGLDFGGVNTAAVFIAKEPRTRRHVLYRTYQDGGRTAAEHANALLSNEPKQPFAIGGSRSERQWRQEFSAAGLPIIRPPISDVEVGIDRVYALLKNHPSLDGLPEPDAEMHSDSADRVIRHRPGDPYLEMFSDHLSLIDDFESYSRILDDNNQPTDKIYNKETYHRLDALRYAGTKIGNKKLEADWSEAQPFYG